MKITIESTYLIKPTKLLVHDDFGNKSFKICKHKSGNILDGRVYEQYPKNN